ncbi:MAG: diaminopimelate epimerase [Bradymonadia bacterium]|jgi:diaminopimelate epimerase
MTLAFEKWHGLGNDFIVVRDASAFEVWQRIAVQACDRRYGVGADGVLLADRDARSMRVINRDGSRPEMCGNGLRCVVGSWMRAADAEVLRAEVLTDAGVLAVSGRSETPRSYQVETSLGVPKWGGAAVSVSGQSERLASTNSELRGDALGWLVSMGNPHWVHLSPSSTIDAIGEQLAGDPRFTEGTNVEFVTQRAAGGYRVDVWERGCGRTMACGTGAAASLAVLARSGAVAVDDWVPLELPGGVLTGRLNSSGDVVLRGPAEWVFDGSLHEGFGE